MEKIEVGTSQRYEIRIEAGLLDAVGEQCADVLRAEKVLLISDSNVAPLYGERVRTSLRKQGYAVQGLVIEAGEASKNATQFLAVIHALAEGGFSRSDAIVALGGGVVGDLAGFCAATYLRGIPFVQIPTTLLACVDSSVGGKTAVDLPQGKNLLGAFYQPRLVIVDPLVLRTLSPSIYADGMAEVIKYGMIWDAELFEALEQHRLDDAAIIKRCVTIKRDVVEQDEFDNGLRLILNYGHTFGHAIESCSAFAISHGSAVARGMSLMAHALPGGEQLAARLDALLMAYGLETTCPFEAQALYEVALSDKKRRGQTVRLITVPTLGKAEITDVPAVQLLDYLRRGLAR